MGSGARRNFLASLPLQPIGNSPGQMVGFTADAQIRVAGLSVGGCIGNFLRWFYPNAPTLIRSMANAMLATQHRKDHSILEGDAVWLSGQVTGQPTSLVLGKVFRLFERHALGDHQDRAVAGWVDS